MGRSTNSRCKGVGRERRIQDKRLGLPAKQPKLKIVPVTAFLPTKQERFGIAPVSAFQARPVSAKPVEPPSGLGLMPETAVGHGQEGPVLWQALSVLPADSLVEAADRFLEAASPVQGGAEGAERIRPAPFRNSCKCFLGQRDRSIMIAHLVADQDKNPGDLSAILSTPACRSGTACRCVMRAHDTSGRLLGLITTVHRGG